MPGAPVVSSVRLGPPQIERLKDLYAPRLDACLAGLDKYMPDVRATRPDGVVVARQAWNRGARGREVLSNPDAPHQPDAIDR